MPSVCFSLRLCHPLWVWSAECTSNTLLHPGSLRACTGTVSLAGGMGVGASGKGAPRACGNAGKATHMQWYEVVPCASVFEIPHFADTSNFAPVLAPPPLSTLLLATTVFVPGAGVFVRVTDVPGFGGGFSAGEMAGE